MEIDNHERSEELSPARTISTCVDHPFWQVVASGLRRVSGASISMPVDAPVHYIHAINEVEDLRHIRNEIRQQCIERGFPPNRSWFITIAVNEITTNTLRHGNGGVCRVYWTKEGMKVHVANHRPSGFTFEHLYQVLTSSSRSRLWGGHGLRIAAAYSDGMFITVCQGRIHVLLYFKR